MRKFFNSLFEEEPKIIEGEYVDLRYKYETDEDSAYDGIPTVYYDIVLHKTNVKVGSIDLRLKMNESMYYYGHIGYNVIPKYRGNNYSYYACKILFAIAKQEHHLDELYLTCNPDNIASYKILQKLNGELIEVAQIPQGHELYERGEKLKCIFRYKIDL